MKYRQFGKTGLKVSVFSFGNWINGATPENEKEQIELFKEAFKSGINYFDTSENYGYGIAETQLGKALKEINCKREDYVVSTKLFWGTNEWKTKVNSIGLSRKHLLEGIKNMVQSLKQDITQMLI